MSQDPSLANALRELRQRRDHIDQAITALEVVIGADPERAGANGVADKPTVRVRMAGRPRKGHGKAAGGAAGVEHILREHPHRGFHPNELAAAMFENGWRTDADKPARAARAAANRLRRDQPDEFKLEGGKFVFRPFNAAGESEVQTRFDPQTSPPGR